MPSAIAAPQPEAVNAGVDVLLAGGNAVDAAITAAFVQAIVDPQMCGLGGYVMANLHIEQAKGNAQTGPIGIDAPALAGEKVSAEMWEDKLLRPNPDGWGYFLEGKLNDAGYTSICTPGWVKGMAAILERYGTYSWEQVMAPAIRVAEEGYILTYIAANRFKTKEKYPEASTLLSYIQGNAEASRIYLKPDGTPYDMGETVRNPDYANTLRRLGKTGPEDFYTGQLGQEICDDLAANGASVTAADLAGYTLREDMLVSGSFGEYTITSAASPHGGPTLIAILNILEDFDLAAMGHNSAEYIYTVAMAMKAAFADRNPYMADPHFSDVPVEWMMSKARAAQWRDRIRAGEEIAVDFAATETPNTTHVSVVDSHGNAVALTHSLGSSSGVITPGLGFMYNNSMINFHPIAGHRNSIAPGKGRTTGMSPTIVYKGDRPAIVLGSPGATRIITSNVQVILNSLVFGMSATEAVHAARFDCQVNDIRCHPRIPAHICDQVAKRHPISRLPQSHGGFALVNAIIIDPTSGALQAAADTGSDGMGVVV
jgi:gamma-glutamyltranspeptidase/glutathione hydrolase